jgi:signal transduction protein with GAF and PtsI domain
MLADLDVAELTRLCDERMADPSMGSARDSLAAFAARHGISL